MIADVCSKAAFIHPTAIVDANASLGSDVFIGPYCQVGPHVVLQAHVKLFSYVVIEGHTTLEDNCQIYPFACIGTPAQHLNAPRKMGPVVHVGARTIIREHATIHAGTQVPTTVGQDCFLMVGSHIAHDCQVGNRVIMANQATLAGHVCIEDDVFLSGLCAVHQWGHVGQGAMVCGLSGVAGGVIPLTIVHGPRAVLKGLNYKKMQSLGLSDLEMRALEKTFFYLFPKITTAPLEERLKTLPENLQEFPWVTRMCAFIKNQLLDPKRRPLCLRTI